jgi:DNA-binding PadR family transcriptional regulator
MAPFVLTLEPVARTGPAQPCAYSVDLNILLGVTPAEMRSPTLYLLAALGSGRLHGYALIQEVESLSGGDVRLKPGSLYGALERLTGEGLVRVAGEETVDGRVRRYFELTDDGVAALAEQEMRLTRAVRATRRALRLRRVTT